MSKNTYGPGLGDRFALHAAPEAIAAHLNRMRADRDRYTRWVKRLEQLHTQRVAERTDGVWPYANCCNDHGTTASGQGAAFLDPDPVRSPVCAYGHHGSCGHDYCTCECHPKTPPLPPVRDLAAELVDRGDGWHVSPEVLTDTAAASVQGAADREAQP